MWWDGKLYYEGKEETILRAMLHADRTSIIPDVFINTHISQTGDECYSLISRKIKHHG
jgi:hypothetical protein